MSASPAMQRQMVAMDIELALWSHGAFLVVDEGHLRIKNGRHVPLGLYRTYLENRALIISMLMTRHRTDW